MMNSLESQDIHSIGRYIQQHIDEEWEAAFRETHSKMLALYSQIGDSVYAIYGKHLFQTVHEQFKSSGLQASPKLPGSLMNSREWGADESDRQRWMWSKISRDGKAIGTIVIIIYHDHLQIRIPRAFQVIALEATSHAAVINALSQHSHEFKNAPDMKQEVAEYLAANPDRKS
jgi:hypothetical protein